ncbi:MAG TPA: tripartite tricarboxylate transporter substrate binding protein [Burkholderiaceae bacterium]|nr:tripartite tricarboxylate transporter substrate binding protein [Burkholderiaceae bacterium]
MKIIFRALVRTALTVGLTSGLLNAHAASDYPNAPIQVVTPTAAGGGTDIVARLIAERLAPMLGQSIVVNNKPGAGGAIGNQFMRRENNDGHSLFVTANSNQLILPWVMENAGFDPIKDYEPIAGLGVVPYVLAVHPSFEAKDLKEFLRLIKENPGDYYYASAGIGTLNHLIPEMLASELGTKMEHVPYRGVAPAMTDVLGGQIPILFGSLSSVLENIRSGKLRALAVSGDSRLDILPGVPAIAEEIPGFRAEMWVALYAPAGTPEPVVEKLEKSVRDILADPAVEDRFKQQGMALMKVGSKELAKLQEEEYRRWGEVVKKSGANAK